MQLLFVIAFVLAPVLLILLPAHLLEALLHTPLSNPVLVFVPILLLLPPVLLPLLPVLLPTPWLKPLLVVLLLTPAIVSVISAPFPARVPYLVLLGTFAGACSCTCVLCILVGPVAVPGLFVTPPCTWAALWLQVPLLAPLLALVQLGRQFVHSLTLELVVRLPVPVFTFLLCAILLVAVFLCWPACACASLLLLHYLLSPTYFYPLCRTNLPPRRWLQRPPQPHPSPFNHSHCHQEHGLRRTGLNTLCSPSSAMSPAMPHLLYYASWPPLGQKPAILGRAPVPHVP